MADDVSVADITAPIGNADSQANDSDIEALLSALDGLSDDDVERIGAQRMGYGI
jgi:hypothetical protein